MNDELRRLGVVVAVVMYVVGSGCAEAQTSYRYEITPYLFTTGVNGTIGEQGRTAQVDASFGDIVHHLRVTVMVYFDARFGRWRALVDNLYVNVADERATPGPLFDSVKVASKMWMADGQGAYAVIQNEDKELDVTAGVRTWNLNNQLNLFRGGFQVDRGAGTQSIVDPVIGTRFYYDVSPKIFVTGKADIGGFNAAASIDWQAFARAGYKINDTVVISGGYRYMAVDYTTATTVFNISLQGAIVGIGVRF